MTVKDLIEFLQKQDQNLQVTYDCCSEQCVLEAEDIRVYDACAVRPDGWVQNARGDKPAHKYLGFPGN